jgi:hypothetical protein
VACYTKRKAHHVGRLRPKVLAGRPVLSNPMLTLDGVALRSQLPLIGEAKAFYTQARNLESQTYSHFVKLP